MTEISTKMIEAMLEVINAREVHSIPTDTFYDALQAALAVRESTHVWQDMASAPREWTRPIYLAWWRDGSGKLKGRKVAFCGEARWFATEPNGDGEWHTDKGDTVLPDQAYAWCDLPKPPALSASGDSHE